MEINLSDFDEDYGGEKRMTFSEYRDLTPSDNLENCDEYIKALNWALNNKKIKNIALTGPYGSGKSSIIETFLSKNEKTCGKGKAIRKNALKISMATFLEGSNSSSDNNDNNDNNDKKDNRIALGSDEIETGILKQLFYKVKPEGIPQSRYRKLRKISRLSVFLHSLAGIVLLCFACAFLFPDMVEKSKNRIMYVLPESWHVGAYVVVTLLMVLMLSMLCAYLYFAIFSKLRVKEIKMSADATIQTGKDEPESVFNKNLDEIMYFFEVTKYRIVFFEDLDRLSDSRIFVHLRELNNLLNNDDAIEEKPIVFVYAVKDDIFSKDDRTKFFDFIIPVIPFINSTNSGEELLKMIHASKSNGINHDVSQSFILDVAPYISDMRILINIYNEFVIYKRTLSVSQDLMLSDEQMLSMIIFKNLYPDIFSAIQNEDGIIKDAFHDKQNFILKEKNTLQRKIDNQAELIHNAQEDVIKSIRELKYAMVATFMGGPYLFQSFIASGWGDIQANSVMSDDFDMTELLKKNCTQIRFSDPGMSGKPKYINTDDLDSYIERWQVIKTLENEGKENIKNEIQEFRQRQHDLSGMTLKRILELYSAEEVLSEEVYKNKLLMLLLRRGYIDETDANYINYFKGTSITTDDMNFILSVKNQSPLDFDYKLTRTSNVIDRLQKYEFEEKAVYNFDLTESLLTAGASEKLNILIQQLSDESETSWKFIDEFVDRTKHPELFIQMLTAIWDSMWLYIVTNETLTYDRQIFYLQKMIDVSVDFEAQNVNASVSWFFEEHEDILQKLRIYDASKVISIIKCTDVKFNKLSTDGVSHEVLDPVFDGSYYNLNKMMIKTIVAYKCNELVNELEVKPYSTIVTLGYLPMLEYIHENIVDYVRNNILIQEGDFSDDKKDIIDLIIRLNDHGDIQRELIIKENFCLDSIQECAGSQVRDDSETWRSAWNTLLEEDKISVNWKNVIAYWNVYELSAELSQYISIHVEKLRTGDVSGINDGFIKAFILSDSEIEVKEKLIPVLRTDAFDIDLSLIEESTLMIMIACGYFEFTTEYYLAIAERSLEMAVEFILNNQEDYMEQRDNISMSADLLERLLLSMRFSQQFKKTLFEEYAEHYMTEKIALGMHDWDFMITVSIFEAAWNSVDTENRSELLLNNCKALDSDQLARFFGELGGKFKELADRTRLHTVTLPATQKNKVLAEHLQEIGYITRMEEHEHDDGNGSYPRNLDLRVRRAK